MDKFTLETERTTKALSLSAALLAIAAASVFAGGCGSAPSGAGSGTVGATAVGYNRSSHALMASSLTVVSGTYGTGCTGHTSGSDPWSVNLDGTPASPVLQVISTDGTGCQLTVTGLTAGTTAYVAAAPITLGAMFAGTASLFTATSFDPFYANAQMTPDDFSTDFVINVETSDDPAEVPPVPITATGGG